MLFKNFICASKEYGTYEKPLPSPYFKRIITLQNKAKSASIKICGLGFYRLFINGKEITKGYLAPYISNHDQRVYYDEYDIANLLLKGDNSVVVQLGNGMQNPIGGIIWDFDIASFRDSPKLAFEIEIKESGKQSYIITADKKVRTKPSPVFFDDLRSGTFYNAILEDKDLFSTMFTDDWKEAIPAKPPKGVLVKTDVEPITVRRKIKPVSVKKAHLADYKPNYWESSEYIRLNKTVPKIKPVANNGYLYDFGENTAGLVELKVKGTKGQQIELQFCEYIDADENPSCANIYFYPNGYAQRDIYICNGEGKETYIPPFTYHGFRYCVVMGITEKQATPELLTALQCCSEIQKRASFNCSDETVNELYDMTIRSDLSNFYYFPTDCPHREKNGWTGDAAVSAEQFLINFKCDKSLHEWICNIAAAQNEKGQIPGIIPTGTWGYNRLNGPAWDRAILEIPYQIYRFTGNIKVLEDSCETVHKYIKYLETKLDGTGLIGFGLGDWMQPYHECDKPDAPVILTDSILSMDFAKKASFIFKVLNNTEYGNTAKSFYLKIRKAIRKNLTDTENGKTLYDCQTAQAMAIYYKVFEFDELEKAKNHLLELIKKSDNFISCGMLGLRVIFHVLSDMGQSDLAYEMIIRKEFPSYGYFIESGLTTFPEIFKEDYGTDPGSLNHHYFGDISNWFIRCIAGIRVNDDMTDKNQIDIKPNFIKKLERVSAVYSTEYGDVTVRWNRANDSILLDITAPSAIKGKIVLPDGYIFENGINKANVSTGIYSVTEIQ